MRQGVGGALYSCSAQLGHVVQAKLTSVAEYILHPSEVVNGWTVKQHWTAANTDGSYHCLAATEGCPHPAI
jgi:hypothetical protein